MFGEATIHITDKIDLTLGVRQHDQSGYSVNKAPIAGVTAPKPLDPNQFHVGDAFVGTDVAATYTPFEFDKLTSRMALQWQFTDNFMGYVSYAEGFNSGGVSAPTVGTTRLILPYEPSTLENFEFGIRTDLLDGRLRFNATVFDTAWVDLQAAGVVNDPVTGAQIPTLVTTNVGEAEAKGAEFELTFLPTENFMINLGIGVLDTAYTEIKPGTMTGHLPLNDGHGVRASAGFELHGRLPVDREHGQRRQLGLAHRLQLPGSVLAVGAVPARRRLPGGAGWLRGERRLGHPERARLVRAGGRQLASRDLWYEPDGRVQHQLRVLPRHLGLRLRDGGSSSRGWRVPYVPLLRRPKVGGAHAPPIVDELQALASNRQRLFLGRV